MARLALLLVWLCQLACQEYSFEQLRPLQLAAAKRIQVVKNFKPTDILFVIDDSGTMGEERGKLIASLERFITPLASAGMDFHLGIVTTDVDCLVPDRCCPEDPNQTCDPNRQSSTSCCRLTGPLGLGRGCTDQLDRSPPHTTCNGGRLRAPVGQRYFRKPNNDPNAQANWVSQVTQTISDLGLCGSSYESGLEAMVRAIYCGKAKLKPDGQVDPHSLRHCPDTAVAQLNTGFIRDDADLVIVLLTDEDDCSFRSKDPYYRPNNPSDSNQQARHLCEPEECYAHYACRGYGLSTACQAAPGCRWDSQLNRCEVVRAGPATGWITGNPAAYFRCGGQPRVENPPYPDEVTEYIALVSQSKNSVGQIRVAGVLGGRTLAQASAPFPLAFQAIGCAGGPAGVNSQCGCLNTYQDMAQLEAQLACQITQGVGGMSTATPFSQPASTTSCFGSSTIGSGCQAMPASRYEKFLLGMRQARIDQGVKSDTLVDSICNGSYEGTIEKVVNTLILTRCFDFDPPIGSEQAVIVRRITPKGGIQELPYVEEGSSTAGFSISGNRKQICLEGPISKESGDTFEIYLQENGRFANE